MEEKTLPAAAFFKGSGFFPDTETAHTASGCTTGLSTMWDR